MCQSLGTVPRYGACVCSHRLSANDRHTPRSPQSPANSLSPRPIGQLDTNSNRTQKVTETKDLGGGSPPIPRGMTGPLASTRVHWPSPPSGFNANRPSGAPGRDCLGSIQDKGFRAEQLYSMHMAITIHYLDGVGKIYDSPETLVEGDQPRCISYCFKSGSRGPEIF